MLHLESEQKSINTQTETCRKFPEARLLLIQLTQAYSSIEGCLNSHPKWIGTKRRFGCWCSRKPCTRPSVETQPRFTVRHLNHQNLRQIPYLLRHHFDPLDHSNSDHTTLLVFQEFRWLLSELCTWQATAWIVDSALGCRLLYLQKEVLSIQGLKPQCLKAFLHLLLRLWYQPLESHHLILYIHQLF